MAVFVQLLASVTATIVAYGVYRVLKRVFREITSPLRDLPGPESTSLLYGNVKEIRSTEYPILHEKWTKQYGSTIRYKAFFGTSRLYTTDTKALNHILMNTHIYEKPEAARYNLTRLLGAGILVVEGDQHKKQRKVMNPAFGPSQVRELTELFVAEAIQLRDIWVLENAKQGGSSRVDVLSWLSRVTLNIIGSAGFNYKFNALGADPKDNELNTAFATMFKFGNKMSLIPIIRTYVPLLRFLQTDGDRRAKKAQTTMARIANQLLRESKASIHDKGNTRDLLSLLMKSNMDTDIPEHQRMSDQDVISQVPTFLVAGHETTSTGTTWALFALSQNKAAQNKLREELLTVDTENPTMEQLNALPYLDMVVRETLRVHAPAPSTLRTAVQDDILPLAHPVTDRKGVVHNTIRVSKGQTMLIPIVAINRDPSIWGEDAREFRPERWEDIPEGASNIPGVWGNLLTFLGGPRACIGYRFALVEMKALLFTLVRAFEFDLAVPAKDITKKSRLVQRPMLVTDPDGGNQMPMFIRTVTAT